MSLDSDNKHSLQTNELQEIGVADVAKHRHCA
jgi:hypothetical protein